MGEYSALNVPRQAGFVTFQSIPLLRDHFRVCEIIFLIAKRYHRGASWHADCPHHLRARGL